MAKDNGVDSRFANIGKDPRFRKMQKDKRKVKIDKRFQGMFKNKNFKLKYSVDKRGRPIHLTSDDHLKKYYEMSDSESSSSDDSSDGEETVDNKKGNKIKKEQSKYQKDDIEIARTKSKVESESDDDDDDSDSVQKTGKKDSKKKRTEKGITKKVSTVSAKSNKARRSEKGDTDAARGEGNASSSDEDEEEEDASRPVENSDQEESNDESYKPDLARGEGNIESSEDDDSDDTEEDEEESEELDHNWGELDKDAVIAEETTNRLAVCNIDWDRIKAKDLLVLLSSFKPADGTVKSVTVYPSEYGLQRLKEEDMKGPPELVENKSSNTEEEESEEIIREKLRKYQLNRLRYYYAVAELDSVETAEHLYEQLNGMEYESSATRLDLRFIPNDMTFDQEPSSVASEMPDMAVYKPSQFFTTALCQSKVDLTWDETDKDRTSVLSKKFTKDELEEMDVKDYLASDSDYEADPYGEVVSGYDDGGAVEEEDEEDSINKYRKLLQGIENKEKAKNDRDMEMEITWEPGLSEKTEELIKKKNEKDGSLTPWEQFLQKKREKKKQRKLEKQNTDANAQKTNEDEEAFSDDDLPEGVDLNDPYFKDLDGDQSVNQENSKKAKRKKKNGKKAQDSELTEEDIKEQEQLALMLEDEDDKHQHFSLAAIMEKEKGKSKKKSRKKKDLAKKDEVQDNFKVDVSDSRFDAIYTSHLYNVDPSAPEYKKTISMEAIIKEKQKRRERKEKRKLEDIECVEKTPSKKAAQDAALSSLVKSVKSKTANLKRKKAK